MHKRITYICYNLSSKTNWHYPVFFSPYTKPIMIIETKLSEKEFISASVATFWSRGFFKILLIGLPFLVAFNIFSSRKTTDSIIPTLLPAILIFGLMFLVVRFSLKKAYRQNHRAGENIEYNFTDTHLVVTGESFSSEMTWEKIHKVTRTKNWLFVWHSGQIANAIPLRLVSSEEMMQLKEIMEKNKTKNTL